MSELFFLPSKTLAVGGGVLILAALAGAAHPSPLSQTGGGLWEVTGAPGSRPVRQCLPSTEPLAQFEHRGERCTRTLVRHKGDTAVFHYDCPGKGFGQSEVTVMTPRSLRIETQGISRGLPFRYVIQARRVSACAH